MLDKSKPEDLEIIVDLMRSLKHLSNCSQRHGLGITSVLLDAAFEDVKENVYCDVNFITDDKSKISGEAALVSNM